MSTTSASPETNPSWRRAFYTIWAGQAVSILTSAIVSWGIIFHLTYTTGSGAILSVSALMSFLPQAILGPIAGPIVDRLNRKSVLICADAAVAAATAILIFAALAQALSIPLIFVILCLRAIGQAFHTPTIQAVTPQLVPQENLMEVGGYTQAIQSMGYIAGAVGGAILYPIWPLAAILALDIIGAAAAIFTVAITSIPRVQAPSEKLRLSRIVGENIDTWHIFRAVHGFPQLMLIGFIFMVCFSPLTALYPLMTLNHFTGTEFMTSIVEVAFAGGMMVGGIFIGRFFSHVNRGAMIIWSILITGIITAAMGLLPNTAFVWFVILNIIAGIGEALFNTPFTTLMQERIPTEYLGRTFSLFSTVMLLSTPIGLIFSSVFSDTLGVALFFVACGVAITILGIATAFCRPVRTIENKPTAEV